MLPRPGSAIPLPAGTPLLRSLCARAELAGCPVAQLCKWPTLHSCIPSAACTLLSAASPLTPAPAPALQSDAIPVCIHPTAPALRLYFLVASQLPLLYRRTVTTARTVGAMVRVAGMREPAEVSKESVSAAHQQPAPQICTASVQEHTACQQGDKGAALHSK